METRVLEVREGVFDLEVLLPQAVLLLAEAAPGVLTEAVVEIVGDVRSCGRGDTAEPM